MQSIDSLNPRAEKQKKYPPDELCRAQKVSEIEPCKNPRGLCTKHCGSDLKRKPGETCPTDPMGNGRCRMHGGKTPQGIGLPQTKSGIHSKNIPARYLTAYEEHLADPGFKELRPAVAVMQSMIEESKKRLDSGESGWLWKQLRNQWREVEIARRTNDLDALPGLLNDVGRLIRDGAKEWIAEEELITRLGKLQRLIESERKREIEEHKMMAIDKVLSLMGAMADIVRRNVPDEGILRAIDAEFTSILEDSLQRLFDPSVN